MCIAPRAELATLKADPKPQASRFSLTPLLPLIVVGAGVLHGALQEELMSRLGGQTPLLITCLEFLCCSSLSVGWLLLHRASFDAPRWELFRISVLVLSSLVAGNLALRWVSYPVKVVLKSTKLLPTMAIGSLILKRTYSFSDCCAAALICLGLIGFALSGSSKASGRASSPVGVSLLLFSVSCDAVQVILQERMMRRWPELTPMHVMAHTNGFSFLALTSAIVLTGELTSVPTSLPWGTLVLYGCASWIGVCAFIELSRERGATSAVIATNARKACTVALSFVLFPKPLRPGFVLAGCLVCGGIYVHSSGRRQAKAKAA